MANMVKEDFMQETEMDLSLEKNILGGKQEKTQKCE